MTLCFSANGRLATGGTDGSIVLFDKEGQTMRRLEKVHGGTQVKTLCFLADGHLASGGDDGSIVFSDREEMLRRLEQVQGGHSVLTLCFSADGHLASGGADGSIVLFNKEGQTTRRLEEVDRGLIQFNMFVLFQRKGRAGNEQSRQD